MRGIYISVLALSLPGCAVTTASGTEEAVLFSGEDSGTAQARAALQPHDDLPMAIEFSCPTKIATLMTSIMIPFPPVLPAGFANEHVSYLHVRVPQDAQHAVERIRILTPQGTAIPLADAPKSTRPGADGAPLEVTYTLNEDCAALDGGRLEVAGFSYKDRAYPASAARLQFDSRIRFYGGLGACWKRSGICYFS